MITCQSAPALYHLSLESVDLLERDHGVIGAGAYEDFRLDLSSFGRPLRLQAAVKADDPLEWSAIASEFERERAAHAESNRGQSAGVGLRE